MRKSKFSPTQIAKILKEFDLGKDVETIARDHGVSKRLFINGVNVMAAWRQAN